MELFLTEYAIPIYHLAQMLRVFIFYFMFLFFLCEADEYNFRHGINKSLNIILKYLTKIKFTFANILIYKRIID